MVLLKGRREEPAMVERQGRRCCCSASVVRRCSCRVDSKKPCPYFVFVLKQFCPLFHRVSLLPVPANSFCVHVNLLRFAVVPCSMLSITTSMTPLFVRYTFCMDLIPLTCTYIPLLGDQNCSLRSTMKVGCCNGRSPQAKPSIRYSQVRKGSPDWSRSTQVWGKRAYY